MLHTTSAVASDLQQECHSRRSSDFLPFFSWPAYCAFAGPDSTPKPKCSPEGETIAPFSALDAWGIWGASPPRDVVAVLSRPREACLSGIALFSDRQPARIRVDNHTDGPPAIWPHNEDPRLAWIILDVGPLDWSKLSTARPVRLPKGESYDRPRSGELDGTCTFRSDHLSAK